MTHTANSSRLFESTLYHGFGLTEWVLGYIYKNPAEPDRIQFQVINPILIHTKTQPSPNPDQY